MDLLGHISCEYPHGKQQCHYEGICEKMEENVHFLNWYVMTFEVYKSAECRCLDDSCLIEKDSWRWCSLHSFVNVESERG